MLAWSELLIARHTDDAPRRALVRSCCRRGVREGGGQWQAMACRSRLAVLSRGAVQCLVGDHGALPAALPAARGAPWDLPHLLRPLSASAAAPLNTEAIKELRARTGAPVKDVKAALEAANWDMEAATTELRKKGMASAGKRKAREASEGLLGLGQLGQGGEGGHPEGSSRAALVEVNCETDFVARNDLFRHLVSKVASAAAQAVPPAPEAAWGVHEMPVEQIQGLVVDMAHSKMRGERSVEEAVAEVSAVTGENVVVRRALGVAVCPDWGTLGPYIHGGTGGGLGRIGAVVALSHGGHSQEGARGRIEEAGRDLAMHVVALRPQYLSRDGVPEAVLAHEKDILRAQALESGKPEKVVEKMVTGRMERFYGETVLLEQPFVRDASMTIAKFMEKESKELNIQLQIRSFLRMELGQSPPTICVPAPPGPDQ